MAFLLLSFKGETEPFLWVNNVEGRVIQKVMANLDHSSHQEAIILTNLKKKPLSGKIYIFSHSGEKLWESRILPVWKIWIADVNHDKKNDLIMALYKYERIDQKIENRLYIYGWDGEDIYPIWRGTSLSRPYIDCAFYDINGDGKTELISLEKGKNKRFIVVYHWNGFGFTGEYQKELKQNLKNITGDMIENIKEAIKSEN